MESMPAFARVLARSLAHQQQNTRLFRKPYLKYGKCFGLWGFLFEVGGLLGAKHSAHLDEFGNAFLGYQGPPNAMRTFLIEVADKELAQGSVNESMSSFEYVQTEFIGRHGFTGDRADFLIQHAMDKMELSVAAELAWQYAQKGSAIGATRPTLIQAMFERTYALSSPEQWQDARAAGLDIPETQPQATYLEAQDAHNEAFLEYCSEARPILYPTLSQ